MTRLIVLAATVVAMAPAASSAGQEWPAAGETRPRLAIAAPDFGCPHIDGTLVALLDAGRGMLVLSAAPFEGAHRLGTVDGGPLQVRVGGSGQWALGRTASDAGTSPLWGNVYPFMGDGMDGCVAVEKQRFSSEGDLVTYLRYVAEDVYAHLPAAERERFPGFRLGEREVAVGVEHPGFKAVSLTGKEGASLAFRYPDVDGTLVLVPFVVDEATGRLAVRVLLAEGPIWESAPKRELAFVVAGAGHPAPVAEPALTITVQRVGSFSFPPEPGR